MSKKLSMLLMVASLVCLGFSSSIIQSAPQPCAYRVLLDDKNFSILNCTFTPKDTDFLLEIFYKVISDSSNADQIQYVLTQNQAVQKSIQKLQPPVQHIGQTIKGEFLLQRKFIVQDWTFSLRVHRVVGSYKQVLILVKPKLLLRSIWKKFSNLVTVTE